MHWDSRVIIKINKYKSPYFIIKLEFVSFQFELSGIFQQTLNQVVLQFVWQISYPSTNGVRQGRYYETMSKFHPEKSLSEKIAVFEVIF